MSDSRVPFFGQIIFMLVKRGREYTPAVPDVTTVNL
jgi:hypothetical protein